MGQHRLWGNVSVTKRFKTLQDAISNNDFSRNSTKTSEGCIGDGILMKSKSRMISVKELRIHVK
jgi:hypothetical protein